ncbi:MAG TPA: hypothetical protein VD763_01635 [Candidatus Saccharimonadales bacterium]|nr:hypothetical protein [Candidatus Saccharimonadales bacterium]
MDPMIDLVRDRTADLQRTADAVRRDRRRDHGTTEVAATTPPAGLAERAPATLLEAAEVSCADAECAPATARHAA